MAIPNGLDPAVSRLRLPGDVVILSGTSTDNTSILIEVGTPGTDVGTGSMYIGNSTSTPTIWFGSSEPAEWTSLTLS